SEPLSGRQRLLERIWFSVVAVVAGGRNGRSRGRSGARDLGRAAPDQLATPAGLRGRGLTGAGSYRRPDRFRRVVRHQWLLGILSLGVRNIPLRDLGRAAVRPT